MKKPHTTILEGLKDSLNKITAGLRELGYSEYETNYATTFYAKVKALNILGAPMFKKQMDKYDVDLPLADISFFTTRPQLFMQVVVYILHAPELVDNYTIKVDNLGNVTELTKNQKSDKEKADAQYSAMFRSRFDEYRVREDANYITYFVPTHEVAKDIRSWFKIIWEPQGFTVPEWLLPGWCVYSSSAATYFYSYKGEGQGGPTAADAAKVPIEKQDHWFVTYSKRHITDILKKGNGYNSSAIKDSVMETYLRAAGPNKHPGGAGLHSGDNDNLYNEKNSRLVPKLSYSYETLGIKSRPAVGITNGELVYIDADDSILKIPQGVHKLNTNAIISNNVETIYLPASVVKIDSLAIQCPNLRQVIVTHNLEIVEDNAIVADTKVLLGVLEKDNDEYYITKPLNLRYCDRKIRSYMKQLQDKIASGTEVAPKIMYKEAVTEAWKTNFKAYDYYQDDMFDVSQRIITGVYGLSDGGVLVMPDNTVSITSVAMAQAKALGLKKLVISPNAILHNIAFEKMDIEVDLTRYASQNIEAYAFKNAGFSSITLPANIYSIEALAFMRAQDLMEVTILNPQITIAQHAFRKCPLLDVVYVKDFSLLSEERQADIIGAVDADVMSI